MKTELRKLGALMLMAGLAGAGCGAGGENVYDDFVEAIPDLEVVALDMDGGSNLVTLSAMPGPVEGEAMPYQQNTQALMGTINRMLQLTHASIDTMVGSITPVETGSGGQACKVWEADGRQAHWTLASCVRTLAARHYGFVLKGRPLGSDLAADDLVVAAGEGHVLGRYAGLRRGFGAVGYNLDNLAALTGEQIGGTLGIGYRAAGRLRALNIGLDGVLSPALTEPYTALYRYRRLAGAGGWFRYLTKGDYLTLGADQQLTHGYDGVAETVRLAVHWNSAGAARSASLACGGTVGDGCVRTVQCWRSDGRVTFQDLRDGVPVWSEAECADVYGGPVEPPAEDEFDLPDTTEPESGAPSPGVPEESAEE